ncbi:molecular chaperone TorD [Shewanella colwelliana]|uniref:Molecular chaperone TorD n=1 Tax=Shewanella colwelliana TaxID=23 RepID=A0A1E5IVA8_SHECO|nr:molecular chaperone TorD family protein [Shewanella colwelliana]OEG73853.1 molecular chaperone TorD [Shewanella colwelliana]GIU38298.1 molecular chaperone TorD [Shewanella colwelliana]
MSSLTEHELIEYQGIARILHNVLFNDPTPELIQKFIEHNVAQSWPEFTGSAQESSGRELLSNYLGQWTNKQQQSLKLDYAQLFYGPGEPNAVPWGSVYLSERQLLNDKTTLALKAFYQEQGISFELDTNQPVDHIGLIFAVLDQMLTQWAKTEDSEAIERSCMILLQQHLLPWSGRCLELMTEHAKTDFYRGIAQLTQAFLAGLIQRLNLVPMTARLYR